MEAPARPVVRGEHDERSDQRSQCKGTFVDEMNRDFLVAVMALRTDTISRPDFAAAMQSWSRKREQPLTQILKESAGLDDTCLQALECLAAEHLKSHQDDLRLSLNALDAEDLIQDAMTEIADVDPRTILNTTLGCESTLPMDQAIGRRIGRFVHGQSATGLEGTAISSDPPACQRRNRAGFAGARF